MANLAVRYFAMLGGTVFAFANFIACGSHMYQVSVHDDLDHGRVTKQNPQAQDPESTLYGIHASQGWDKLPIEFRFGAKMNDDQKKELMAGMRTWEWATGKKLFKPVGVHQGVDGDTFKDLYSSLDDDVNGHYIDFNWTKTGKPEVVLATTIWDTGLDTSVIAKADIRFNEQYYIIGDSLTLKATDQLEVVDMQSLATHELGHLLGLAHIDEAVDSLSIMNPSLFIGEGLISRELSRGDIMRIQQIYGCAGAACDIDALLETPQPGANPKLAAKTTTTAAAEEEPESEAPEAQVNQY